MSSKLWDQWTDLNVSAIKTMREVVVEMGVVVIIVAFSVRLSEIHDNGK